MNDIKRGEMFYISRGGASYNGSEQHSDRPAVVVSNNKNNENSNVVEIVYMTTQPKTDLPTHVTVRSTGRISTVLCEQVYSVSTERVTGLSAMTSRNWASSLKKSVCWWFRIRYGTALPSTVPPTSPPVTTSTRCTCF